MAGMGGFEFSGLKDLQKNMEKLQGQDLEGFVESCAKELAARLLAKTVKRTPVGQYASGSGKKGGALRRGWTSQKCGGSEGLETGSAAQFADTLQVSHFGNIYVIEIVNPVEYASYVEYGHRTADHKGWVRGQFMLTISEREIEQAAPKILEKKIKKFLGDAFK